MEWIILLTGVVLVDLALSGDNAVVVAAAASGLSKERRDQAILYGIGAAIALRILLTGFSSWLLGFKGVAILGGLALLWIAYKMGKSYLFPDKEGEAKKGGAKDIAAAVTAIVIADISMSIDNVAAIAAMTRGHPWAMAFGLILSVAIMFVGAKLLMPLLDKYKWINLLAAAFVAVLGVQMLFGAFFSR